MQQKYETKQWKVGKKLYYNPSTPYADIFGDDDYRDYCDDSRDFW